jgi:hypothetical protein
MKCRVRSRLCHSVASPLKLLSTTLLVGALIAVLAPGCAPWREPPPLWLTFGQRISLSKYDNPIVGVLPPTFPAAAPSNDQLGSCIHVAVENALRDTLPGATIRHLSAADVTAPLTEDLTAGPIVERLHRKDLDAVVFVGVIRHLDGDQLQAAEILARIDFIDISSAHLVWRAARLWTGTPSQSLCSLAEHSAAQDVRQAVTLA